MDAHSQLSTNQDRVQRLARTFFRAIVVALGCISLRLFAADPVMLKETLANTQAVAHVRVIKLVEELQDSTVQHIATLSLCGRSAGLGEFKELATHFSPSPPPSDKKEADPAEPVFVIGSRCIALLTWRNNRWETLRRLKVTEEGIFDEEEIGQDIGLKPGTSADAVVQFIAAKIKKSGQNPKDRPKPPPTARNQPWNLMRASPLRRVWPFFPR